MRTISKLLIAGAFVAGFFTMNALHAQQTREHILLATEITQGEAALMLANRMGLGLNLDHPLTPMRAIQLLMAKGIVPFGGWQIDEPMMEHDLARVLVFAVGRQDEIPEGERNNPETTAFREFLVREFNLDLASLRASLDASSPRADVPADPGVTTDPLSGQLGGGESAAPGGLFIPVTEALLIGSLQTIVPSPGDGDSGRPGGGTSTTPSTPAP